MNKDSAKQYRHIFLFNPNTSKIAKVELMMKRVKEVCENDGLTYEIFRTNNEDDGPIHLISEARAGIKIRAYICGGDGTINNIIGKCYEYKNIEFAIFPMGTGNDFARNFGSLEELMGVRRAVYGNTQETDLLLANGKPCINMLNIGFDGQVVSFVQRHRNNPIMRTPAAYSISAIIQLIKLPTENVKITFDDGTVYDKRFLLTAVANGQYCGGGFCAASHASTCDGLIDVLIAKPIHRKTFFGMVGPYKKGTFLDTHKGKKIMFEKKCKSLTLEKNTEFEVCNDGDIITVKKLEINIVPKAFKLVLPLKGTIL